MSDKDYDVRLSNVEPTPENKKLWDALLVPGRQLNDDLRAAYNKYAASVMEMRDGMDEESNKKVVDTLGYEHSLIAAGKLFAELLVMNTTPEYAMAFFTRVLSVAATARMQTEAKQAFSEFFENLEIHAQASKNPNN